MKRGYISISPNPKDGRGKLVYLTANGRRFRDEAIDLIAPDIEQLSRRYDFSRLEPFLSHLQDLREVMDRYRDDDEETLP